MIRLSVALALALLALSIGLNGSALDQQIFKAFNLWASQWPPIFWSSLTILGDTPIAAALLVPCLWWRPQVLVNFWLTLPFSGLVILVAKRSIESPRPAAVLDAGSFNLIGPLMQNHSFPSGHTFTAYVVLTIVMLSSRSLWVWSLGLTLGTGVALSRMAVGAHWPGDVMAGAALGWCCGVVAHQLGVYLSERHPVLCRQCLTRWMAVVWLTLGLYLFRLDTAYPLANSLQWLIAVVAIATSGSYLAKWSMASLRASNLDPKV